MVGEPGRGGSGIEGGGVGKAVGAPLRVACDEEEPDLARAIAAASGESDSRLGMPAASDAVDWRLNASTCCYLSLALYSASGIATILLTSST